MSFQRFFNNMVRALFACFVLLMVFVAVSHPYAAYSNGDSILPLIGILFLIAVLSVVFLCVFSHQFRLRTGRLFASALGLFARRLRWITIISFICMAGWQLLLIYELAAPSGWDVASIFNISIPPFNEKYDIFYLSTYPNNSFVVFVLYIYFKIVRLFTDLDLFMFSDLLNMVAIDCALILTALSAKRVFGPRTGYAAIWAGMLMIGFSPWVLITYTDTLSLPFVAAGLFLSTGLLQRPGEKSSHTAWKPAAKKFLLCFLLGIFISFSYLIKPSAVILYIAFGITFFVQCFKPDFITLKNFMFSTTAVILGAAIIIGGFGEVVKRHHLYKDVDQSKSVPMTHFIMMGLSGMGGFTGSDATATLSHETKQEKTAFNVKVIKERLKAYGIPGYTKFLFKKYRNNTADGTFGWGMDGAVFLAQSGRKGELHEYLDSLFRREGSRVAVYKFFAQWLWVAICIMMLISVSKKGSFMCALRLSLIGAMVFLLIFEGGRSRYLIQYFPQIIIMSGIGMEYVFLFARKKLSMCNLQKVID